MSGALEAFLSPYFLLRTGGLPLEALSALRASRSAVLVAQVLEDERWRAAWSGRLCDALFLACKACGDEAPEARKALLNVKRAVFNDRKVAPEALVFARDFLPPQEYALLAEWHHRHTRQQTLLAEGEAALQEESDAGRLQLQRLAGHAGLLRGMPLASARLFEKLRRYAQTPVAQQDGRLRKVEVGLLAYLSRMAAKTSPFSSFTSVTLGRWDDTPGAPLSCLRSPTQKVAGSIQVGHLPYRQLEEALLRHPVLRQQVPLWVNPHQWVREGRRYVFLRREDGSPRPRISHTAERISVLADTPQLETWGRLVRSGRPYGDTLRALSTGGASADKLVQAVERLLETGVLQLQLALPEQRWELLAALREAVSRMEAHPAPQLLEHLVALERCYSRFEAAAPEERLELVGEMQSQLGQAFSLLGARMMPEWEQTLVYEDTTLEGSEPRMSTALWGRISDDVLLLQRLLPLFSGLPLRLRAMTRFFVQLHGRGGTCDNLLDFYERAHRPLGFLAEPVGRQRPTMDLLTALEKTPFAPPELPLIRRLRQEFLDRAREELTSGRETWNLSQDWLRGLSEQLPPGYTKPWASFSYLAQVVAGEDPLVVLNAIQNGHGQFFARFAALTGGKDARTNPLCQGMREVQSRLLPPGEAQAELLGVFGFNGCLHPRMTPYLIAYPAAWPEPDDAGVLQLSDLRLTHLEQEDRLQLFTRDGVAVHPAYLGMLVPSLTPPLFQFLMRFGEPGRYGLPLADALEAELPEEKSSEVRRYPRVMLGRLVLKRRQWMVPTRYLPRRGPGRTDFQFMLDVRRWREQLGLPGVVFTRVSNAAARRGTNDTENKPQLIDFDNPFLLRLFEKQIEVVRQSLQVEEMLPAMEQQVLHLEDGPRVSELLFEVNEARWRRQKA